MIIKKCSHCDKEFETHTKFRFYCAVCEKLRYQYEQMGVDIRRFFPQEQYKRMGVTQSHLYLCKECGQYKRKTEFHTIEYERTCIVCKSQPVHTRKLQKILGEYASNVENLNQ